MTVVKEHEFAFLPLTEILKQRQHHRVEPDHAAAAFAACGESYTSRE